ncbi:MAG: hypothetical protein KTR31_03280 [Myxococcales bacterium]|nr:hypothetical protein [Myxococcales bacterium]
MMLAWMVAAALGSGIEEAETCLRTKVWEGYADGWGVRTMTSAQLEAGKTRSYLVTLYAGNTYKMLGCAEASTKNLDILLYTSKGELLARDDTSDREPQLSFTPEQTGTFYVVLYLRETSTPKAAAALAVSYR